MKEFRFWCGFNRFRYFVVKADTRKQAIQRFKDIEAHPDGWLILKGFSFKDVTLIEEIKEVENVN